MHDTVSGKVGCLGTAVGVRGAALHLKTSDSRTASMPHTARTASSLVVRRNSDRRAALASIVQAFSWEEKGMLLQQ